MKMQVTLTKTTAVLILLAIAVVGIFYSSRLAGDSVAVVYNDELELKFASLSKSRTNACSNPNFIDFKDDDDRLQGACCSVMDLHRYKEQVEGLKKYSSINKIPSDPYDIPVSLAKELLEYQKTIVLTAEQQAVYDDAMKFSHEGGPCCCKCWRWYAFEGLAKYLITEHDFDAEQIAEVWDLEDGCGGSGHAHESIEQHERETFEPQNY